MIPPYDMPKELIDAINGLLLLHHGGDKSPGTIATALLDALDGRHGQAIQDKVSDLIVFSMKTCLQRIKWEAASGGAPKPGLNPPHLR